jgi:hypothetical protein
VIFDKIDQLAKNAMPMTVMVEVKKTKRSLVSIFQIAAKIKIKKMDKNKLMMRMDTRLRLISPSNLTKNRVTAFPAKKRINNVMANRISDLMLY